MSNLQKISRCLISVSDKSGIVELAKYLAAKGVEVISTGGTHKLLQENKMIQKMFWGNHLWGRGYFVTTSGNVTDEIIMEYIMLRGKSR